MIKVENISKSFGPKILLNDICYHMPEGEKIALIGNNGSGKTTFLKILMEEEEADSGNILKPGRLRLGYLKQEANPNPLGSILDEALEGASEIIGIKKKLDRLSKEMETSSEPELIEEYSNLEAQFEKSGGYHLGAKAESILMGLGFSKEQMSNSPISLSGGWAMRLEMAKMLMSDPNFLILDEPTNHLDLPSLIWFENYLKSYKGTLLFVSHDQELLERLPTITLHLHYGQMRVYPGNFKDFERRKEERNLHEKNQITNLEKKKAELNKFITRFGAKATKAKQAKSKEKQVEKLQEEIDMIETGQQAGSKEMVIQLPPPPPSDRVLYRIEEGSIGYKEKLFEDINLQIEKGQKIAVIGANGIGKSTLLKSVACEIEKLGGVFTASTRNQLAYFSQNLIDNLPQKSNLVDILMSSSEIGYKEARSLLGALLFTSDDLEKKVEVLSGGEKNRVALACVLAKKANFILLDEPTNHLDIDSARALVSAFKKYKGTILFVSHNRYFINEVATHVLALSRSKKTQIFEGQLKDYERLANVSGFPNVLEENIDDKKKMKAEEKETESTETLSYEDRKKITKEINRLEKKLLNFESEFEKIEQEEGVFERKLEELALKNEHEKLVAKSQELDALRKIKAQKEEEWLEDQETLESLKSDERL